MADLQMQMMFRRDISAPLLVQTQVNLLMQGDNEANALVIDLYDGDQPADASGYTVAGYLLRADGAKVPLKGSVNGNRVTAVLNKHCYLVPGPYGAFVRLEKGEFKRTVLKIAGEIESEGDGPIVDIDEKFVTVEDVIEQMEAMIQVTEAAQSATAAANAAASSANTATSSANTAAAKADAAAEAIEDLTVSSENVGPGTDAGVKISTENGKKNIHFKLPQGQTGATPDITFEVETGPAGSEVKVSQSGTAEAPVIRLTIPRGDTGSVDGVDYYEGEPAALGTASPGTANGVARGNHVHPMPTAEQVGARPDTWMPDASDVGALPASGTAADSAKLEGETWAERLLDIYPVGSIYLSVNSTSPASLFGGTWEQLKDRFLLGAGGSYSVGSTGGEKTVKLTCDQLPSFWVQGAIKDDTANQSYPADAISGTEWTTHFRQSGWVAPSGENGKYGNDEAHNNMPPYLAVYMWKRVA